MTHIVIYDDTVSAFSNPTQLQAVYGIFWDVGVPISLGITPMILGTANNPSIPADKRLLHARYRVTDNTMLCNYLNVMAEQRLVEVCQMGFHGTSDEFSTDDDILLQQKIEEGQAELGKAFPDAELHTVCAPPSNISDTAIQLLTEYDFNIGAYLSISSASTHPNREALNDARALFYYGQPIDDATLSLPPSALLGDNADKLDYFVLRASYTSFFHQAQPNSQLEKWRGFCEDLLAMPHITVDTFSYI